MQRVCNFITAILASILIFGMIYSYSWISRIEQDPDLRQKLTLTAKP